MEIEIISHRTRIWQMKCRTVTWQTTALLLRRTGFCTYTKAQWVLHLYEGTLGSALIERPSCRCGHCDIVAVVVVL
jgi:hypothetical protein